MELVQDPDKQWYWHIYPEVDFVNPVFFDAGRTTQRICKAVANELPWPLNKAAGEICDLFAEVFDIVENAINQIAIDITKLIYDDTGGWVGLRIRSMVLAKIPRDYFPGTGTNPDTNRKVPVFINQVAPMINSANELDVRFLLLPTV